MFKVILRNDWYFDAKVFKMISDLKKSLRTGHMIKIYYLSAICLQDVLCKDSK